jgi:hypothetical protein
MSQKLDVNAMKTTGTQPAIDKAQKRGASNLSSLSRTILRASYQRSSLNAEAKAKARSQAFANLIESIDPRKI